MKTLIRSAIVSVLLLFTFQAHAQYNDNMRGVLSDVMVYTDGGYIYFRLKNQPVSHPYCNPDYFVISEKVPYKRREMLLSRLLTAYRMEENVNIGYDSEGDCVHGYMRVHRVG